MKHTLSRCLFSLLLLGTGHTAWSQQVYRCAGADGVAPEYINSVKDAQARNCQLISGGNVTVVQIMQGARAPVRSPAVASSSGGGAPAAAPRSAEGGNPAPRSAEGSSPAQRVRDSDSRGILEAELRKSEATLAELQKEYNNGQPEKQGIEGRNYQRYLDRVNEMKENITRTQSDIGGLKREISRLPAPN